MIDSGIESPELQAAKLRSERTRIKALIGVFAGLLAIILVRGTMAVADGHWGVTWPFALLLAVMTGYEFAWLRFIKRCIDSQRVVSTAMWTMSLFIESLLPTTILLLQIHVRPFDPSRALTSPAVLAYFVLIILSTLHLNVQLSRLSGAFAAGGYAAVVVYVFAAFPEFAPPGDLLAYGICFSSFALLLIGGFAAGAVAEQIRQYVIAALREAASRAKFENDLGIARSIQQGLLPSSPPQVDGFDIAGWNQPADETGGDYFDWQPLADGRVAVTIADVSGHGIGPALCMSACRAYARMGFVKEADLRVFLGGLNKLLNDDLPTGKFVTLAAGVLDPAKAVLQLISAGHGPLVFYSLAEDRFQTYDAQGVPLGILGNFPYGAPHVLNFAPGDILLLVTDGFTEWANVNDEDFGTQRLQETIRAHRTKPAAEIISELYSAVIQFSGRTPQLDDLTAVVVKRN